MDTVELAYDVYETPETIPDKCPIVLMHGLFWNKYMLRGLAEALCRATNRKVFNVDLRCHDQSPFRQECTTELMAEDVKRFIEDRGLGKVAFVCHSFSCTVAYLVAIDEPESVEKIVMIDHLPYGADTETWYSENVLSQFQAQNRFLTTLDPSLSLAQAKKKILDISKNATTTVSQRIFLEKVAYELTKVKGKFGWKTPHHFLIEGFVQNFRPTPRGSSDHEILIIRCPDSARVLDEKFEKTLKYNPNAKLITIEDTTHLLMFEKQEEFLEIVKDFLA